MDELKTVYVVTQGDYSEYHIVEVFTDKGTAEQFAERLRDILHGYGADSVQVEEYELSDSKHNVLTEFPDGAYLRVLYFHDDGRAIIDVHNGVPTEHNPTCGRTIDGNQWTEFCLPTSITPETIGLEGYDTVDEPSDRLMKIIRDRVAQIRWSEVSGDD